MQGVEANKNQSDKRGKLLQKPTLLSKHQQSAPPVSNKGDSITSISSSSSKPFQLAGIKSMRTSKGTPSVTLKPKLSIGSQLPLKRLSPDSVRHDDDFEWKILAAQMICFYSLGSCFWYSWKSNWPIFFFFRFREHKHMQMKATFKNLRIVFSIFDNRKRVH